jgi:hypothetical protein
VLTTSAAMLPLLALSTVAVCLAPSPQAIPFNLEGKITEQSAGKLTVSTEQNIIFHVSYNDKTEIKRDDGAPASGQDLRVGLEIKVDGELAESGEIDAKKIVIEKPQKSKT